MTVAYAAARAVGSIPLMPGGLLVVEAVLVPGLVSSGMTLASAISAMLIYRLVSWIFISAIGWVVFFFMFRTEKDIDPDVRTVDEPDDADAPQFSPTPSTPPAREPAPRRDDRYLAKASGACRPPSPSPSDRLHRRRLFDGTDHQRRPPLAAGGDPSAAATVRGPRRGHRWRPR